MAEGINTNHISYVANLLRSNAHTMAAHQDQKLFLKTAEALENRAARITYGTPATSSGKLDILV